MAPGLAGVGYLATLTHRQPGGEVAQHWAWHENPTKKGEWSPLPAGHSNPNPRQGSAWSLFAGISFPPGAVLQLSSRSPHNTSSVRKQPQLSGLEPRGRFLTGASQYSFTEGLGATLVHPKKGLAQRDKETHCSPSVDMEVGHPGFPVQQHCWHSWKSHLAINLAPMSWAMKRPSPQSQQKVSHFP